VTPETVAATPTITTMTKSSKPSVGNFRSISCSFTSLTRRPPHKTLPKRRVRSGQVGNPDARRTKLSYDGRERMESRPESVLNTSGILGNRMRGMQDLKEYSGRGGGTLSRLGLGTRCCERRCLCIDILSMSAARNRITGKLRVSGRINWVGLALRLGWKSSFWGPQASKLSHSASGAAVL
jgi:hypothetical protein